MGQNDPIGISAVRALLVAAKSSKLKPMREDMEPEIEELIRQLISEIDVDDWFELLISAGFLTSMTSNDVALDGIIPALLQADEPSMDAVLLIWTRMAGDIGPIKEEVTQVVSRRMRRLPPWLLNLDDIYPRKVVSIQAAMGEEETFIVGVNGPRGGCTIMVAVSHLGAPYVEDIYTVPERMSVILKSLSQVYVGGEQETIFKLEDARANLEEYLRMSDNMWPPIESDTLPSSRPLLEWMMRLMPEGGAATEYLEWSDKDLDDITQGFMNSPHAQGLDSEAKFHAKFLFGLASNYGPGDPRQWSRMLVEYVLTDLAPRKLMAPDETMIGLPRTLRALIKYAHELLDADDGITQRVIDAVDLFEPDYKARIADQGVGMRGMMQQAGFDPARLFEAVETGDLEQMDQVFGQFVDDYNASIDDADYADEDDDYWDEYVREFLIDTVGSEMALYELDTVPLPVEDLNLDRVDASILVRYERVGDMVRSLAQAYFGDQEMVTASLRILHMVALEAPKVFGRKSSDEGFAGAICWIAGRANGWFQRNDPSRTISALTLAAGLKASPVDRGKSILRALGRDQEWINPTVALGDAGVLTSPMRGRVIEMTDEYFG